MDQDGETGPTEQSTDTAREAPGPVTRPYGVTAEMADLPRPAQTRDAEGLTPALASVRAVLRHEGAKTIDCAPRGLREPLLLFCPGQGGWQVGHWNAGCEPACWVAAVDGETVLDPSHWVETPPPPE